MLEQHGEILKPHEEDLDENRKKKQRKVKTKRFCGGAMLSAHRTIRFRLPVSSFHDFVVGTTENHKP